MSTITTEINIKIKERKEEDQTEEELEEDIKSLQKQLQRKKELRDRLSEIREAKVSTPRSELVSLAYKKGVKCVDSLTKKTLCETLNVPHIPTKLTHTRKTNPIKTTLTAVEDNEKIEFSSLHKAAFALKKKSHSNILYYIKNKTVIPYKEKHWTVSC